MYLVRAVTNCNTTGKVDNETFNEFYKRYGDARLIFEQRKDDLLAENDFDEFIGQEWNDENIKNLDRVLREEGLGGAEKDYVEIDGSSVSLEEYWS